MSMQQHDTCSETVDRLLALLAKQRAILQKNDPAAVTELESATLKIEQAMISLGALVRRDPGALATIGSSRVARLQDEALTNQAMLAGLAAGNRRALNTLFGEPALYGK